VIFISLLYVMVFFYVTACRMSLGLFNDTLLTAYGKADVRGNRGIPHRPLSEVTEENGAGFTVVGTPGQSKCGDPYQQQQI
jgi:hypothetical protein